MNEQQQELPVQTPNYWLHPLMMLLLVVPFLTAALLMVRSLF